MLFKKYLPKIKLKQKDKKEYKTYLYSKGFFGAAQTVFFHIMYIFINYRKLSKNEKKNSYICIRYNAADFPILTISCN